jgi:hypothetical protein
MPVAAVFTPSNEFSSINFRRSIALKNERADCNRLWTAAGASFRLTSDCLKSSASPGVIVRTLSASLRFNSSATSFGIDENTSGGYVDDPNLIDGNEILFMFFDRDVLLHHKTGDFSEPFRCANLTPNSPPSPSSSAGRSVAQICRALR